MRLNLPPNQIVTVGASEVQIANTTLSSKHSYTCANAQITRGFTHAPYTIGECLERFPNIKTIANSIGVCAGNYWRAPKKLSGMSGSPSAFYDLLTGITSDECDKIKGMTFMNGLGEIEQPLGTAWMGCLWGSPMSSFSCTCPDVNERFADYLKLRLNDATFWYTPAETPVKRAEFTDLLQHGEKLELTVAGDFNLRPGRVVELYINNMSAYPIDVGTSILSKKYYVLSVKHIISNSGVHETFMTVSSIDSNEFDYPAPSV